MWVWIYLAIAVAGLAMVACFAVWLWRKALALLDEAGVLLDRADQLAGLLEQIGQPETPSTRAHLHSPSMDEERSRIDLELGTPRR
jgi:hypothetical protein